MEKLVHQFESARDLDKKGKKLNVSCPSCISGSFASFISRQVSIQMVFTCIKYTSMERLWIIKNWLSPNSVYFIRNRFTRIIILVNLFYCQIFAQTNLVPNGSFENYSTCPTIGPGEINKANPWFQPNYPYAGAGGSSDYYNFCAGFSCNNLSQCPRTGVGLAGIAFFFDTAYFNIDKWREYIEVGLMDSLKPGKKYCVRYYANKVNNTGMSCYPIKQLQAVLTNDSLLYNDPNYGYISGVTPIMEADNIISDTINWIPIQTTYTANGGERFITIGNFSPGNQVNFLVVGNPNAPDNTLGYYYIDDVSLYEQPEVFAGNDTILPQGDSVQLGSAGRLDVFYSWQPVTGLNNPNIANPIAKPPTCITYTLTVTDTNQLACTNVFKDMVKIDVQNCDTSKTLLTIPNIFTPNNDGINDVFKIISENIVTLNCKIYNRWGILVSELTKINEVWDGLTTSGLQCANGVYYYVVTAKGGDGKEYNEKGFVSLVR